MGYKAVQVLLLLLLCDVGSLVQGDDPPLSTTASVSPTPSSSPPSNGPGENPPPRGAVSPSSPPTSPAPPPASTGTSPTPSPKPSLPSSQTTFGNWTVNTTNTSVMILTSINKKFAFNLIVTDNSSSCVALVQHVPSKVTVWVANFLNESPKNQQNCSFIFNPDGLKLSYPNQNIWIENLQFDILELDDRGCLLAKKIAENSSLWNSFDYPSDIIITEQRLNASKGIWAADVDDKYQRGSSQIQMQVQSTEVILVANSVPTPIFNTTGDTLSSIAYVVMNNGLRVFPGNFRVSATPSFAYERKSLWEYVRVTSAGQLVTASYVDILQQGGEYYGLCSGNDTCHCPQGFRAVNESSLAFTCQRIAPLDSTRCNSADTFSNVSGMSYSGFMTSNGTSNVSAENCKSLCMHECNCTMALFERLDATDDMGTCYRNLGDLMQTVVQGGTNNTGLQSLFLRIAPLNGAGGSGGSSRKTAALAFAGAASALVFVILSLSVFFLYDSRRKLFEHADSGKWDSATTELLSPRPLQKFTYQELVDSTGNFHQKLGSGGFTSVYAGHLPDNVKIAVKKLDDNELKEKEFLAAVTTIGSIWHLNLVPLLGFCTEGQHRILVYEAVNEGRSLNWYLWDSSVFMNAQTRRAIALETVRGLAHLHEDCNVLHGDLKPENIVIDRSMHPRLADFGLVGLMTADQKIHMATMRNSQGYMAPEWFKSQPIREEADMYSLGVVILELVSGRRCLKPGASPEKCFLPTWGFSLLRRGGDCVLELVDPRLDVRSLSATEQQVLKGMVFVALWCVQYKASMRPPVSEVVRMLEGDASVDVPPHSPALDAFARDVYSTGERAPESSNHSFMHSSSLSRNSDMLLR